MDTFTTKIGVYCSKLNKIVFEKQKYAFREGYKNN